MIDDQLSVPPETEEEAHLRKSELFYKVLMQITPDSLVDVLRSNIKCVKFDQSLEQAVFTNNELDLNSVSIDERDSIIEKPPQVSKMSYCFADI